MRKAREGEKSNREAERGADWKDGFSEWAPRQCQALKAGQASLFSGPATSGYSVPPSSSDPFADDQVLNQTLRIQAQVRREQRHLWFLLTLRVKQRVLPKDISWGEGGVFKGRQPLGSSFTA